MLSSQDKWDIPSIYLIHTFNCFLFTFLLFISLPPATSWAWGPHTHEKITKLALIDLADARLASEISKYADQPDCYTDTCCEAPPPCNSNINFKALCWFSCQDAPKSGDVPCMHGHRITKFLVPEDKWFYYQNKPGAEVGAAYWAERARKAFSADKDGNDWKRFLGWATHYVADALCPPHCYREDETEKRDFWEGIKRHLLFETSFDTKITTLSEWGTYEEALKNPEETLRKLKVGIPSPTFSSQKDIEKWIADISTSVSNVTGEAIKALKPEDKFIPPFLPKELLEAIFAYISIGIRGIYRYVTEGVVVPPQQPVSLLKTATVLVMDVSGSMSWQWRGGVKIESAKKRHFNILSK